MARFLALLGLWLALAAPVAAMPAARVAAISPNVCAGVVLKTDFVANGGQGVYCLGGQRFASFKEIPGASFTRASIKTCSTSAGLVVQVAAGAPCITDLGLLVEESRTNTVPNSSMIGAGIGTSPTGWTIVGQTGVTASVVGVGTDARIGLPYIDVRWVGTASGAGTMQAIPMGASAPATNGQSWTGSWYMALSGGSLANIAGVQISINEYSAGATFLVGSNTTVSSPTSSPARMSATRLNLNASTAFEQMAWFIRVAGAGAVDVTTRLYAPQLELGAFATSYIPTTSATATRAADVASVAGTAAGATGTLIVTGQWDHASTQTEGLTALSDGTGLNQIGAFRTSTGTVQGRYVASSVDTSPGVLIGAGGSGRQRVGITWSASRVIAASGGTISTAGSPSSTPVTNTLYLGLTSAGASPVNGYLASMVVRPVTTDDAQIQALTQ